MEVVFELGEAAHHDQLLEARFHGKAIAEQMGHSDGGVLVLKRYGHLYKGARRQAANALESHVFGAPRNPAVGWTLDEGQLSWDIR